MKICLPIIKFLLTISLFLLGVNLSLSAQDSSEFDWEHFFTKASTWYDEPDSTGIQKLDFYLAYMHQVAVFEGEDRTGRKFSDEVEEIRRFWAGFQGDFLTYFSFKAVSQIAVDRHNLPGGTREWGHQTFRNANITFKAHKLWDINFVDTLTFGYGRRSARMADEWQRSATAIHVLERSAFSNKLWPADRENGNPLAAWVKWEKGIHTVDMALFSGSYSDYIDGWNDSILYYTSWEGDFSQYTGMDTSDAWLSFYYQEGDIDQDRLARGNEWATSFVTHWGQGPYYLHTTLAYGNNGDQTRSDREGDFYGLVVMPMYWIQAEKQRLVLRYQYQAAEESQGIRLNSRYARLGEARDSLVNINSGRGDEHHSYYIGYNYYIFGDNLKFVNGLHWDILSSNGETLYKGWYAGSSIRILF